MSLKDINKAYVSPYDIFLANFDAQHKKSASQLKEINKHKRIFYLRDNANPVKDDSEIWDEF